MELSTDDDALLCSPDWRTTVGAMMQLSKQECSWGKNENWLAQRRFAPNNCRNKVGVRVLLRVICFVLSACLVVSLLVVWLSGCLLVCCAPHQVLFGCCCTWWTLGFDLHFVWLANCQKDNNDNSNANRISGGVERNFFECCLSPAYSEYVHGIGVKAVARCTQAHQAHAQIYLGWNILEQ
jgi:hypothetical protein